jgi:hypothetical protein
MVEHSANRELVDRERIGNRGQWFALLALTEPVGKEESLFRPFFLGDKYPSIDCIVELADAPIISIYSFLCKSRLREQVTLRQADSESRYPRTP